MTGGPLLSELGGAVLLPLARLPGLTMKPHRVVAATPQLQRCLLQGLCAALGRQAGRQAVKAGSSSWPVLRLHCWYTSCAVGSVSCRRQAGANWGGSLQLRLPGP